MKKVLKVLSLVLVFVLIMAPMTGLAFDPSGFNTDGDFQGSDKATALVNSGLSILMYVGYAVAVVMILWLGIQWLLATPNKKAELKGRMWSMAIGITLLVGGLTIIKFVFELSKGATETLG